MNCFYSGCVLLVLCFYTSVLANSEICYGCSGIGCEDPFNSTNAIVMNCSAASSYRVAGKNIDLQLEENIFPSLYAHRATTDGYVCTTYIYESDSTHFVATVRRCIAKTIGTDSSCEAIKKSISTAMGKVLSCSTCDSDLCNSGVSLTQSYVIPLFLFCFLKILE